MIDKRKIIIMTKLAKYDKNFKNKDKNIYEYFRHDYVFKKNMKTRMLALLGGLIIVFADFCNKIFLKDVDIFTINYREQISIYIVFLFFLLFFYTSISSLIANFEYTMCQNRLKNYMALFKQLESFDIKQDITDKGVEKNND